jgi:glycosyltransferase involved in cell wall biosynthesis
VKILLCHNQYQQPGGEDRVFASEASLLESRGHQVVRFTMHNDSIEEIGRLRLLKNTFWNADAADQLEALIRCERPELMHCTNIFPLISPAAYYAAKRHGVAVVQSLHNYRLLCPKAQFVRNGRICESCLGKSIAWPAVVHGCYRDSRPASAAVAAMLAYHWGKNSWTEMVDRYIVPTRFVKDKYVQGGLPADKIDVKPNFVFPDPGSAAGGGSFGLFVGRLSAEKGIETLLDAWRLRKSDLALKIIGDGPLANKVQAAASADRRIEWLGHCGSQRVFAELGQARCLIMPSICYETFGLSMIEAFAKGTPVIASNLGAMAELVEDDRNGLLFAPGDPHDLAQKVDQLLAESSSRFRDQARNAYQQKYTADKNYDALVQIYEAALGRRETPQLCTV